MTPNDDRTRKYVDKTKHHDRQTVEALPETGGSTDQPPVIIGNGSLFIDMPLDKELALVTTTATGPRPVRYKQKVSGTPTKAIGLVQALILKPVSRNPVEWYPHPLIAEGVNAQLHIWLAKFNGAAFVPIDISNPQVVIMGNPLSIEVDKMLGGPSEHFKSQVPFRYQHPGYGGVGFFRIYQWRIVDSGGGSLHTRTGDDDYILHVSFHD